MQNCQFLEICRQNTKLVQKHSQKNDQDVILHYISLSIYPLRSPKFCRFAKVIVILIMTAQVLFFYVFLFKKDLHLNAIEGAKNISAVSSAKNSKYENLTDKKILPCGKS